MSEDIKMLWYCVYSPGAFGHSKVVDQVRALVVDEPAAKIEVGQRHPRTFVYTSLSWDFLREALPACIVGVCDNMNKKESSK